MTDKQTSAAEKAALEHLSRHKEMGIEYSDSAHIGIFLAGVKWGKEQERYMAEQRGRIDKMLDDQIIEAVREAVAEIVEENNK